MCFCSLLSAPLYKLSSSSHMFFLQLVSTLRRLRSSTFFNHLRLQKSINFNPQTSEDFNSFRTLREYLYIQYIFYKQRWEIHPPRKMVKANNPETEWKNHQEFQWLWECQECHESRWTMHSNSMFRAYRLNS